MPPMQREQPLRSADVLFVCKNSPRHYKSQALKKPSGNRVSNRSVRGRAGRSWKRSAVFRLLPPLHQNPLGCQPDSSRITKCQCESEWLSRPYPHITLLHSTAEQEICTRQFIFWKLRQQNTSRNGTVCQNELIDPSNLGTHRCKMFCAFNGLIIHKRPVAVSQTSA